MSTNVTTIPRPDGRSIGTAVSETGNMLPSRRTNQSSSMCSGRPVRAGSRTRQSSTGNGEPSRCL